MKKKFKSYNAHYNSTLVVEIDYSFSLKISEDESWGMSRMIKNMVESWSGWESQLRDAKGDYAVAFCKRLHEDAIDLHFKYNYNAQGIKDEFEEMEDYAWMGEDEGINILFFTEPGSFVCESSFTVEELKS